MGGCECERVSGEGSVSVSVWRGECVCGGVGEGSITTSNTIACKINNMKTTITDTHVHVAIVCP